jgi:hypothetical protein
LAIGSRTIQCLTGNAKNEEKLCKGKHVQRFKKAYFVFATIGYFPAKFVGAVLATAAVSAAAVVAVTVAFLAALSQRTPKSG